MVIQNAILTAKNYYKKHYLNAVSAVSVPFMMSNYGFHVWA